MGLSRLVPKSAFFKSILVAQFSSLKTNFAMKVWITKIIEHVRVMSEHDVSDEVAVADEDSLNGK